MFKRIDHIEIVPNDLEKTLNFYTQILGFKIKERRKVERPPMQELVFIELNDSMIEMISVKDPPPSPAPHRRKNQARRCRPRRRRSPPPAARAREWRGCSSRRRR